MLHEYLSGLLQFFEMLMVAISLFIIFAHLSFILSQHVPCFFFHLGSWAEKMPSVCLALCISLLMGAWNRSEALKHIGRCSTQTQSFPFYFTHTHRHTLLQPFDFTLCGVVFVGIMGACIWDSSLLVAHPFVPTATFIPTSEPSVHQSLSPSVLPKRVTDTQSHWPQDL